MPKELLKQSSQSDTGCEHREADSCSIPRMRCIKVYAKLEWRQWPKYELCTIPIMRRGGYMNKNQFAAASPKGWNSYDYYDTAVTEEEVKANARFMAEHLKAYGYEYVVIDIEWYARDAGTQRPEVQYIPFGDNALDEYGRLQPAENRFPSSTGGRGFRELSDYVHSLGLKFGIHIMRGIARAAAYRHLPILGTDTTADKVADPYSICPWNPDMYGVRNTREGQIYYDGLIQMYADWGVDFIKCDDICDSRQYPDGGSVQEFSGWHESEMIHNAIMKTGRPIVLSLSPGPAHLDRAWFYAKNANMWRITDDFWDSWPLLLEMFSRCEKWQDHVACGCYPDCDMLPIGVIGKNFHEERRSNFTDTELRTMLTLWNMFGAPLMIGGELTKLSDRELRLLTNKEILDLNDGTHYGRQISRNEEAAVWINTDCSDGHLTVAMFNLSDEDSLQSVRFDELGLEWEDGSVPSELTLHELWDKTNHTADGGVIEAEIPAHGVKVYRIM